MRFGIVLLLTTVLVLLKGGFDRWLALYLGGWSIFGLYAMVSIDDDLARERFRPPEPGADRLPLRAIRLIALAHLVIGTLDAGRWHLAEVPGVLRGIALVLMVPSALFVVQAMRANRFFSPVVRVQRERGHQVIDSGPYGTIRHPGYRDDRVGDVQRAGARLWLGFAFAAIYAALILRRGLLRRRVPAGEPRRLRRLRARVPYRLIPGGW